ncbi:MAG: PocR ligand-binding domain-containing protein [Prolixibacteraceae bacterium]|jgi:ligand-binding sensor protein|nr:PocR ligand-binding domain-containing protein [Prolixibacteraceae bacterium]
MSELDLSKTEIEYRSHALEISMARFIRTPKMNEASTEISISDILDVNDLKDIMEPFYETTGLGVGLFDRNSKLLTSAGWQKICTNFHQKHPEAHRACIESERFFKKNFEANKAISYKCKNGLWDMAYPIYLDDEFLGSIYFGQFVFDNDDIDKSFFIGQAQKFNFDTEEYIGLLKKVPILNKEKVDSYIKLFVTIIEKIAKVGKL